MRTLRLSILMIAVLAGDVALGDDNRRNPFAHAPQPLPATTGSASATEPGATEMRVRAILMAGDDSLVSIDGELLAIGESHRGFVLTKVQEDAAIFVRDGETLTVGLFEQRESDDET